MTPSPLPPLSGCRLGPTDPWLGLHSFSEAERDYFFGRDEEINDLFQRVQRNLLTLLFGQSGLGKTSLLKAGIFPRLKAASILPVYIRLDHEPDAPPLRAQAQDLITRASGVAGKPEEFTLWEWFHDRQDGFLSASFSGVEPLLVFDQFEEIFTVGNRSGPQIEEREAFFQELADLAENRVPASLEARADRDPHVLERFDLGASPCRILITLREDYLSQIEAWRNAMPSMMRNRMALRQLAGSRALDAVMKPAPHLVDEVVAREIVRFVAGEKEGDFAALTVPPALLSLVCRELNRRRSADQPRITAALLQGSREEILTKYYEECFDGQPPALRNFVEDRLLVPDTGYRDSVAEAVAIKALNACGVPASALRHLIVERRLLTVEERGEMRRIELTHDVLAPIVKASRDERVQREEKLAAEQRAAELELATKKAEAEQREGLERERILRRRYRQSVGFAICTSVLLIVTVYLFFTTRAARRAADGASREAKGAAARAQASEAKANDALASSLIEEGRAASLSGDASHAAVALNRAWLINSGAATANVLLSHALAPFRALVANCAGHTKAVTFATFDAGDTMLLTASSDATAKVWSARDGRLLSSLEGHRDAITAASFSPDSKLILLASRDATASVYEVATGRRLAEMTGHTRTINAAQWNHQGTQIVTASSDGTARLWNPADGRMAGVCDGHGGPLWTVEFSPDDRTLLTASQDGTAALWDAESRKLLRLFPAKPEAGDALSPTLFASFNPSGSQVLTATADGVLTLWDAGDGHKLQTWLAGSGGMFSSARFSKDGQRVIAASSAGGARILDAAAVKPPLYLTSTGQSCAFADFSPDGGFAVTADEDGTARLWNSGSGALWMPLSGQQTNLTYAAFSNDGRLLATCDAAGSACLWDLAAAGVPQTLKAGHGQLEMAAFSPDGRRIVTASHDNTAHLWDPQTAQPIGQPMRQGTDWVLNAIFSPDSRRVFTIGGNEVRVFSAEDGAPIKNGDGSEFTLPAKTRVISASLNQGGDRLAGGDAKGGWTLWDTRTGKVLQTSTEHIWGTAGKVEQLLLHPSGQWLLTAGSNSAASSWAMHDGKKWITYGGGAATAIALSSDATANRVVVGDLWGSLRISDSIGNLIRNIPAHSGRIDAISFSPDGAYVATGSLDGLVKIWNMESGRQTGALSGHTGAVHCIAWHPTAPLIVTGGDDGTVRLWDRTSSKPLGILMDHTDAVRSVSFSPDGSLALSASRDGTAKVARLSLNAGAISDMQQLVRARVPTHYDRGQVIPGSLAATNMAVDLDGRLLGDEAREPEALEAGRCLEEARLQSLANDQNKAAAWLAEALRHGADGFAARYLAAHLGAQFGGLTSASQGHPGRIESFSQSRDGRWLASAALDNTAALWDAHTGALRFILRGHQDWVFQTAFSPDSTLLATRSRDGTIRLWDVATGAFKRQAQFHQDDGSDHNNKGAGKWVRSLVFNARGNEIYGSGDDEMVRVWSVATGKQSPVIYHHKSEVTCMALTPGDDRMVTGTKDGCVHWWDTKTHAELGNSQVYKSGATLAAISANGSLCATADGTGLIQIWDVATAKPLRQCTHSTELFDLKFSPDSSLLLSSGNDNRTILWDPATARRIHEFDHGQHAAFSPDGKFIITTSGARTAKLWETRGDKPLATFTGHTNNWITTAFTIDGQRIVTASDGVVRLWDTKWRNPETRQESDTGGECVPVFTPNVGKIATLSTRRGAVSLDLADGRPPRSFQPKPIYFPHDGGQVRAVQVAVKMEAAGDADDSTADESTKPPPDPAAHAVAAKETRDTEDLIVAELKKLPGLSPAAAPVEPTPKDAQGNDESSAGGARPKPQTDASAPVNEGNAPATGATLTVTREKTQIDPKDGKPGAGGWRVEIKEGATILRDFEIADPVPAALARGIARQFEESVQVVAAVDNALHQAVVGTQLGEASVWDVETATSRLALPKHDSPITSVCFSSDERFVAVIDDNGRVDVCDAASGKPVHKMDASSGGRVNAATFSRDGNSLMLGESNGTAAIYESKTGARVALLPGHTGRVLAVAISADGRRALTGGEDKTARLWDLSTGRSLEVLTHYAAVTAVAFSPDSTCMVTGTRGWGVLLWDGATARQLASLANRTSAVTALAFNADASAVAATFADGHLLNSPIRAPKIDADDFKRSAQSFVPYIVQGGDLVALPLKPATPP